MNFGGVCKEGTCRRFLRGGEGVFCTNIFGVGERDFPPAREHGAPCA
jgi:hypothetical protein